MGTVEILDHTADVGFSVRSPTLIDLFETSAMAMCDYVIANPEEIRPLQERKIELQAETLEDLLFAWLNELLFLIETEHVVLINPRVEFDTLGQGIVASILGEPIDHLRHLMDHEVKAITRHEFDLSGSDEIGWVARFILDI